MSSVFYDRLGNNYVPDKKIDVIKQRQGAFIVSLHQDSFFITYQKHAPEVPEFPGGGVDEGETFWEAGIREFREETGSELPDVRPEKEITRHVNFYAEDANEYWIYEQKYFLVNVGLGSIFFKGQKQAPENGKVEWVKIENIKNYRLHYFHALALKELME